MPTDPQFTFFGNHPCKICGQSHPSGHDCVLEARRRSEQMTESLKNIQRAKPRNLLEDYDAEIRSGSARIECGKLYPYHVFTFCFQGIDTINVKWYTRTGILVQGLELWYRTDTSQKLPFAILGHFLAEYGFKA